MSIDRILRYFVPSTVRELQNVKIGIEKLKLSFLALDHGWMPFYGSL
jgi:hypothetical protein